MKGKGGIFVLLAVTCLSVTEAIGRIRLVNIWTCSPENVVCSCGTGEVQIHIPIKRCMFFYHWKLYCAACEGYDKATLCSQFRHCLSCYNNEDGGCSACPAGRYGKRCEKAVVCPDPGTPENGIRESHDVGTNFTERRQKPSPGKMNSEPRSPNLHSSHFEAGTLLSFSCKPGYNLVGSKSRTCQASGEWSGVQPHCDRVCGKSTYVRGIIAYSEKIFDPWHAMLAHKVSEGEFEGVCSASLINENWVVTTAHCVTEPQSTTLLSTDVIKIYLGKYYRNSTKDDQFVQEFTVSETRVHPKYDPLQLDSDIALVKLSRPANLSRRVMPICVPENSAKGVNLTDSLMRPGSFVTVTGWGFDDNVLQGSRFMTINNTDCEYKYSTSGIPLWVTDNMFCAGYEDGRGHLELDTGGPAVAYIGRGVDRLWYLVGVASWGSVFGWGYQHYSGYTRVSKFLDYIYSNAGL